MWYLAYRRNGSTRMEVFETREEAIAAACLLIDEPIKDVEIGPMKLPRPGNVLSGDRLREECASRPERR